MRKNYSSEFKVKAVLQLLKGEKTASQLASELEVHPVQLSQWKKNFMAHAQSAFEGGKKANKDSETKTGELYEEIGRMKDDTAWGWLIW